MQRILNLKGESTSEVFDVIQPVIPIVRTNNIVREAEGAGTGNSTIYTTPTDRDFYLTGWVLNFAADAANDAVTIALQTTIDNVTRILCRKKKITATAQSETIVCNYIEPIKIDRGANILIACTFTAGNIPRSATITGYTMDTQVSSGI